MLYYKKKLNTDFSYYFYVFNFVKIVLSVPEIRNAW